MSQVDELDGFGAAARRAVKAAGDEARQLGHDRLGTEHLLLGLLTDAAGDTARALADAGVTVAGARHKVSEAVGRPPAPAATPTGSLPLTARAARALGRARRFANTRRAEAVGTEHLLLGVLDVEGTAGQVLRGLGVDVDRLRAPLATDAAASTSAGASDVAAEHRGAAAACPSCGADLGGDLIYQVVAAMGAYGPRPATVFSCGACGRFLGMSAAGEP